MSTELAIFEQEMRPLAPRFAEALANRMPAERLMRTILNTIERSPALLQCNRQTLLNSAMTFAVLGLEVDGVTGQGYILPFAGKAQPVVGYRGYNTIAARSRLTITGDIVREGDEIWDFDKGSKAYVRHKPSLNNRGRIIAAWSLATSFDRPPIVEVIGLDDLIAVKARSPGAKKKDSPWNDPLIGFPAMCVKTAKRRLARSTPMEWARPEFHYAAAMEEAYEERGKLSYITPDRGVIIEGEASPIPEREPSPTPSAEELTMPREDPEIAKLKALAREKADLGIEVLRGFWKELTARQQQEMRNYFMSEMVPIAEKVKAPITIDANSEAVQTPAQSPSSLPATEEAAPAAEAKSRSAVGAASSPPKSALSELRKKEIEFAGHKAAKVGSDMVSAWEQELSPAEQRDPFVVELLKELFKIGQASDDAAAARHKQVPQGGQGSLI